VAAARPPAPAGLPAIALGYVAAEIAGAAATSVLAAALARGSAAHAAVLSVQLAYGVSSLALLLAGATVLRLAPGPGRPGLAWPGWLAVAGGVGAGLALKLGGDALAALEGALAHPIRGNNPVLLYPAAFARPLPFIALLLALVVVAPAAEELFFRGLVYGWLRSRLGPWPSSLVAGLVFAAAHGNLSLLPPLWLLGVGLCWLYEWSGSLWTSAAAHAALNAVSVALALLG